MEDNGASASQTGLSQVEPVPVSPADAASIPSAVPCPHCGAELYGEWLAELPDETDLTLVFQVAEGQMIQAKTLAGVVGSFDDLQAAIGDSFGANTSTLIKKLETVNGDVHITFRIVNARASAMSARSDETRSGSVRQDASATAEGGDAQPGVQP